MPMIIVKWVIQDGIKSSIIKYWAKLPIIMVAKLYTININAN